MNSRGVGGVEGVGRQGAMPSLSSAEALEQQIQRALDQMRAEMRAANSVAASIGIGGSRSDDGNGGGDYSYSQRHRGYAAAGLGDVRPTNPSSDRSFGAESDPYHRRHGDNDQLNDGVRDHQPAVPWTRYTREPDRKENRRSTAPSAPRTIASGYYGGGSGDLRAHAGHTYEFEPAVVPPPTSQRQSYLATKQYAVRHGAEGVLTTGREARSGLSGNTYGSHEPVYKPVLVAGKEGAMTLTGLFQRDTQVLSELEERIEAKLTNMYLKA